MALWNGAIGNPKFGVGKSFCWGFENGEYKTVGHRYVTDHYVPTEREGYFVFEIYVYPGVRKYKTKKIGYLVHENNDQDALFKRFPLSKQQWFP